MIPSARELNGVLAQQLEYYRARAPEYDQWYSAAWGLNADEVTEVRGALERFGARGDVLEIASGTGWWSLQLARTAATLTCVDGSPEMIRLARDRFAAAGVPAPHFIQSDIFEWAPPKLFDAIFFGFWISHVPLAKFEAFWAMLRRALKPGGRIFLIDERASETEVYTPTDVGDKQRRTLADGRTFTIIKIYYGAKELSQRLAALGWKSDLRETSAVSYTAQFGERPADYFCAGTASVMSRSPRHADAP